MMERSPQELVLQFYQHFDDGNFEDAIALLDPHCQVHLAGMPETLNRDQFADFGHSFFSAFPGGKHQFDQVIVSEEQVITCGRFLGCHQGSFQGLPPTYQDISLDVMHIDRVQQGRIVEHWGQGDALGMMQQLGILFFPGPKLFLSAMKGLFR